jgi:hypothetical protein
LNDVLVHLHDEFSGSIEIADAQWSVQEQGQWLTFGGAVVLPIFVDIPIVPAERSQATPVELELTPEVQS